MARRRLASEMNVVPYIDVMLVLLVIFMITAPLLTQGVDVDLPDADAAPMAFDPNNEPVVLSVDAAGDMYLSVGSDPDAPISRDEVVRLVRALIQRRPNVGIIVEGDGQVPYEAVMRAMAALQAAGARKIGFAADPETQTPG